LTKQEVRRPVIFVSIKRERFDKDDIGATFIPNSIKIAQLVHGRVRHEIQKLNRTSEEFWLQVYCEQLTRYDVDRHVLT
jgi:hypothetical protein